MTNDKFTLSVGQAHQLETALNNVGWTAAELTAFIQRKELIRQAREDVWDSLGFIDCDADPPSSENYKVIDHRRVGRLPLVELKHMKFHLGIGQRKGVVSEQDRRRWEKHEPCLNAHVWYFLKNHRRRIPAEWSGMEILFWGTTYYSSEEDDHTVCSMYQDEKGKWHFHVCTLASSPSYVKHQEFMDGVHEQSHPLDPPE